ncbi:hypothetical protein CC1G_14521 [Coprinopsis cinerea okayama7|uniref:Ribonuclease H1 N-terminal domain-containing protein n=1 Tax=Coprinopsis cinerea (strain Okayama-7 / 130 / ATCC MYA-4618 / FGSC 9003) TaxID=240176 RepID=D6RM58_COPC7|nr:hypothetical protein CC1G_14521 [Coprinopsis cinerea okayama7\|eukprot:XP_002911519.1 hypothetical protein CC1G_14521 [Coprinopsis cinerea okayama7\
MKHDFTLSPHGDAIKALTKLYNENFPTTNYVGVLWASDTESPALLPVASSVLAGPSTSGGRMILHVEVLDPDLPIRDFPLRWFPLPNPSVNGAVGGAVFFRPSTSNPLNPSFSRMLGQEMCSLIGANGSVLAMLFDGRGMAVDAAEDDVPAVCDALCRSRAEPLVQGLNRVSVYASFDSKTDADDVYRAALRKGFVQVVHSNDFDAMSATFPNHVTWDPIHGPWGHNVVTNWWYVVSVGLVPGIYPTWIDAGPQVQGIPHAVHDKVRSKQEAVALYMERASSGHIRRLAQAPPESDLVRTSGNKNAERRSGAFVPAIESINGSTTFIPVRADLDRGSARDDPACVGVDYTRVAISSASSPLSAGSVVVGRPPHLRTFREIAREKKLKSRPGETDEAAPSVQQSISPSISSVSSITVSSQMSSMGSEGDGGFHRTNVDSAD